MKTWKAYQEWLDAQERGTTLNMEKAFEAGHAAGFSEGEARGHAEGFRRGIEAAAEEVATAAATVAGLAVFSGEEKAPEFTAVNVALCAAVDGIRSLSPNGGEDAKGGGA